MPGKQVDIDQAGYGGQPFQGDIKIQGSKFVKNQFLNEVIVFTANTYKRMA